jgi:hypothetical protein
MDRYLGAVALRFNCPAQAAAMDFAELRYWYGWAKAAAAHEKKEAEKWRARTGR